MKSKFFGHALWQLQRPRKQHVIQYIVYWRPGRVLWKFWGIVPITAQDAKTFYEADQDSLACLMMICSNGPSLHEKEEVEKFFLLSLRDSRLSRRGCRPFLVEANDPSVRLCPRPNPLFCLSFRVWRMLYSMF